MESNKLGSLAAVALGLALALGGLPWLAGGAEAASSGPAAPGSAIVPAADSCSTTGYYVPGTYGMVDPNATYPVIDPTLAAYYGYYGYYGGYVYAVPVGTTTSSFQAYPGGPIVTTTTGAVLPGAPVYTATAAFQSSPGGPVVTMPSTGVYSPPLGQSYQTPLQVNYACNASSNCQPAPDNGSAVCPGSASGIALNASLTSATCGSATNIEAKVVGKNGQIVGDGTPVQFATDLGMIPDQSSTNDGIATAQFVVPPKTQGTANITVTSGDAKATATIKVSC